ncbi:MAG: HlyC/CorC family transporter [Gammaproteobacteria bacterium]|uniref:DUF21 domain-containing protein n=1 Tax=SAR86 cluster bacterium TaxID=2030880 RepID=A0A520N1A4_9GAMM|nr:DUF21 domain-containing protein [SAR86 cluster bacterium]RZO27257.1 MAG: DUF21 domain-containing protein [SAR86 cluster bacterium]|tara:strand:+ start:478 stop:1695 length:1218 start_codon:yes stop_codon:yes gene_type:complete
MFDTFILFVILSLVVLIILSAFFSSSETSLMAINQIKLNNAEKKGNKNAKRTNNLRKKINEVLGVILIGNNLVNISASALLTYFIIKQFGDEYVWIGTLILTLFIIIFAEIAPKNFAARNPEAIAYPASKPLQFFTKYLGWISKILTSIGNYITRSENEENYFSKSLNREELKSVLDSKTEHVDEDEMEALKSLLELKDLTVEDILIPISEVISLKETDNTLPVNIEKNIFYPVFNDEENEIIGFIHSKEVEQFQNIDTNIDDFLIDPYYVPESTSLFSQLKQFQKQGNEVGMVVDEYGSFTGLVTLEDLIEQIVGRLNQEEEELRILVNDDLSITAEGSTSIRELNKFMSWKIPEDGAKTLSGFVIDHLDHFPKGNICLTIDGYAIETMKIRENFIDEVKVSRI